MVPMSSTDFSAEDKQQALRTARESIQHGLVDGTALSVDTSIFSASLQQILACFVTLHKDNQLRGCIGSLEAHQSLINDIAEHAFAAAFQDPRFPPLSQHEFDSLEIDISVLSKPVPMTFTNEEDLLTQIQPYKDGLILEHGHHRGTFLPSVWEQLPERKAFLNQLKVKAGLSANWWHDDVEISRYETIMFE